MRQSQILVLFGSIALATLLSTACVSAGEQSIAGSKPAACVDSPPYDTTPYKAVRFVKVAPHVNLEVLDWGGSGETMVLLTGLGDNAHVYDYFAFQFTDFFHVIGITRLGFCHRASPGPATMSTQERLTISGSSMPWASTRPCLSDIP